MQSSALNSSFYFQWHITDACNLRCTHCYQEDYSPQSELPINILIDIADQIFKTLSKWNKKGDISITGGEPLLKNGLFDFVEYLNEADEVCNIDFLTNGTLVDEHFINRVIKLKKVKYIQISLDGASSAVHDSIRGKGTFNRSLAAIRSLIKNGIEVRVMYTLQKLNISDVQSMFDLALEEKISGLTFERMVPLGASAKSPHSILTNQEVKEVYELISKRADMEFDNKNQLRVLKYRPLWVLIDPCRTNDGSNPYKELGSICSIGLDGICILPDATVLACRRLPIPIGNLLTESLEKIWTTSALLWEIADKRNLKGRCKACELISKCSGCRAMAYAFTGDYLEEDPNCWKS